VSKLLKIQLKDLLKWGGVQYLFFTIIASIINYSITPILTRLLEIQQLGLYVSYISISGWILATLTGIQVGAMLILSKQLNEKQKVVLVRKFQKNGYIFTTVLSLALICLFPLYGSSLSSESIMAPILVGLGAISAVPLVIIQAKVINKQKIGWVGAYAVGQALLRLVLTILVAVFFRNHVALLAIAPAVHVLSFIAIALHSRSLLSTSDSSSLIGPYQEDSSILRKGYFSVFVVSTAFLATFVDVLVIQKNIKTEVAGIHAAYSSLFNIPFFAITALTSVAIAKLNEPYARDQFKHIFRIGIIILIGSSLGCFAVLTLSGVIPKILGYEIGVYPTQTDYLIMLYITNVLVAISYYLQHVLLFINAKVSFVGALVKFAVIGWLLIISDISGSTENSIITKTLMIICILSTIIIVVDGSVLLFTYRRKYYEKS